MARRPICILYYPTQNTVKAQILRLGVLVRTATSDELIDRSRIGIRMCLFEGNEIDMKTPLRQKVVIMNPFSCAARRRSPWRVAVI